MSHIQTSFPLLLDYSVSHWLYHTYCILHVCSLPLWNWLRILLIAAVISYCLLQLNAIIHVFQYLFLCKKNIFFIETHSIVLLHALCCQIECCCYCFLSLLFIIMPLCKLSSIMISFSIQFIANAADFLHLLVCQQFSMLRFKFSFFLATMPEFYIRKCKEYKNHFLKAFVIGYCWCFWQSKKPNWKICCNKGSRIIFLIFPKELQK